MSANRVIAICMAAVLCVSETMTLQAEGQPSVFVHGFKSSGDTWVDASLRLQGRIAIDNPQRPSLSWGDPFPNQANQLQGMIGWFLPETTVAVGHSNGGLVSRQWSRLRPVTGIVTLGSPNQGAPVTNHIIDWANFSYNILDLAGAVANKFGLLPSDWWGVWSVVQALLQNGGVIGQFGWYHVAVGLGLYLGAPVMYDMQANSGFLQDLNSPGNLNREAAAIPYRVGIVNIASDFKMGGPFRLSDSPQWWRNLTWGTAAALDGWAFYLLSDPTTVDAAFSIFNASSWLWFYEEYWCRAVSDPLPLYYGQCLEHDGLVPWNRQIYPGAVNILRVNGPNHIEETTQSDDWLYYALNTFLHIPPRAVSFNVSLMSVNGLWVVAEGGGGGVVNADRPGIGPWETFSLVDLNGGELRDGDNVSFRAANGQSLQAVGGGNGPMLAVGNGSESFSIFTVVGLDHPGGVVQNWDQIGLRSNHQYYVCAEGGGGEGSVVNVNRGAIGAWETFRLVVQ